MASDKQIKYEVTAENQGFVKAMEETAAAAVAAEAQIKAAFGGVGEAFAKVLDHIGAIAAVLGGGAVFAKGVDAAKELTGEATALSKALGLPIEKASDLNVALKSIGSSSQDYLDANAKLTRQIRTNEGAVNDMGVATRGTNGQLLGADVIMRNALTGLSRYREGTDRNMAAQALFGKGAAEVSKLLKLLGIDMEQMSQRAKDLGLQIGPEQQANVKAYKETMEGVGLVFEGIENAIGQALIPSLTEVGEWFNGAGPTMVGIFRAAIAAVADVFKMVLDVGREFWSGLKEIFLGVTSFGDGVAEVFGTEIPSGMGIWKNSMDLVRLAALALKGGVEFVFEVIRGAAMELIATIKLFAAVAVAAFHLDWAGVKAAWSEGTAAVEKVVDESNRRMVAKAEANAEAMAAILSGRGAKAPAAGLAPKPTGTESYHGPGTGGKDGDALKAQFAVIRAEMEGQLALQKEYLAEAMQAYDDAYRHNRITVEEFYAAKLAIEQQDLKAAIQIKQEELRELGALQSKADQAGAKPAEKLALKAKEIQLTSQLAVLGAQLANTEIRNARELNDELQKRANRMMDIERISREQAATAGVEMERVGLQQRYALKQLSDAQYLQEEKRLQDSLFRIRLQALEESKKVPELSAAQIALINQQIEELERQHVIEMAKIDKDLVVEAAKNTLDAQAQIEGATTTFLASLGDRTKSVKDKFKDLVTSIERSFEDLIAKNFTKQLFAGMTSSVGGGGAGWLGGLLGNLPSFDVGTSYVPQDMVAKIHKGERIVPAAQNTGNAGGGINQVNHFHLSGPVDMRTQSQIAGNVGRVVRLAVSRNG